MLAIMQLVFHFAFLKQQGIALALSDIEFALLVLATVFIAAGGYIINNVLDVATDMDNKPQNVVIGRGIREATAYNLYFAFTVAGAGLGFYLSNEIGHSNFAIAFVVVAATLYMYANSLKRYLVVGNIAIAALIAVSVLIVGIFDLIPTIAFNDRSLLANIFGVLIDYAIFAFFITLIREIVKDLEDVNGDYNQGMNTLPIALGVARTAKIASVLGVIAFASLGWYLYEYLFHLTYAVLYGLVLLISPLAFFSIKIWSAKSQKDFGAMSLVLKIVMLFGILSIAVITYNMKLHA